MRCPLHARIPEYGNEYNEMLPPTTALNRSLHSPFTMVHHGRSFGWMSESDAMQMILQRTEAHAFAHFALHPSSALPVGTVLRSALQSLLS